MVFRCYCIQNVEDGIQIQVYNIINESVNHSSQLISVKVKKILRKSEAQFREMLRKLRLRHNNDFLIKTTCMGRYRTPIDPPPLGYRNKKCNSTARPKIDALKICFRT